MASQPESARRNPFLVVAVAASATAAGSLAALLVIRSLPRRESAAKEAVSGQQELATAASAVEQSECKHSPAGTRSTSAPGQLGGPPNGDNGGSQTGGCPRHSASDMSRGSRHDTATSETAGTPPLPPTTRIGRHSIGSGSSRAANCAAGDVIPMERSRSSSTPSLPAELLHAASAPWTLIRKLSGQQTSWGPILSEVLPYSFPADPGLPANAGKGACAPVCEQQADCTASDGTAPEAAAAAATAASSSPHKRLPTVAEALMPDDALQPTIEPAVAGSRAAVAAAEDEGTIGLQELQLYYREDGKPFQLGRGD